HPPMRDEVVEAITVGGKGIDWRGSLVAVKLEILPRESALPRIGHWPPLRSKRLAPRVSRALEAAAGRKFPFGFERQLLASPGCVGARILVSDVNDRMVIPIGDAAVGTIGVFPIPTRPGLPPCAVVPETHGTARLPN